MKAFRQILNILTRREKRQLGFLALWMLGIALLETIGVVSIMPFIAVVSNPEIINSNHVLHWLYTSLEMESQRQFLILLGVMVFILILVVNAANALVVWAQMRFTYMRNHSISTRLLTRYLREQWAFFLDRNSSELGKNILTEVGVVISGVLIPGLQLFAKATVSLFIIVTLFVVDPVLAAIAVSIVSGAYFLLYAAIKERLYRMGQSMVAANQQRYKIAYEALTAIKELKVLCREKAFIDIFSKHSLKFADSHAISQTLGTIPRYAMEVIAFGGIVLIILHVLMSRNDPSQAIALVALYAFAGYRLIPAAQVIYQAIANLRVNATALEILYQAVCREDRHTLEDIVDPARLEKLPLELEIRLDNISFRYPGAGENLIENENLVIPVRTTIGIAGQTGSGKTTLVDILMGLLKPDRGKIIVDGTPLAAGDLKRWQINFGYIPQAISLMDDTIAANIALGIPAERVDMDKVMAAARTANLHEFVATRLEAGYATRIGEGGVKLSGGQRQRIGIARALYHDPDILVMDEATSALDGITEHYIIDAIGNIARKKTILVIAHRLTTLKDCDTIYLMEGGRIVSQGTYDELMAENRQFRCMAKAASPQS